MAGHGLILDVVYNVQSSLIVSASHYWSLVHHHHVQHQQQLSICLLACLNSAMPVSITPLANAAAAAGQ